MELYLGRPKQIDNAIYHALGERWYTAADDPIALLRAESRTRNPWIIHTIKDHMPQPGVRVLDIGCGGGFLTNPLAQAGFQVMGVDQAQDALEVARAHDATGSVDYRQADALHLPFADASFDAVCAMDFLEHIEDPAACIREAGRVLRPGGLFFFSTFERNPLAWLLAIKAVVWLVKNTPPDFHIYRLFLKKREVIEMCAKVGLEVKLVRGLTPRIFSRAGLKILFTGRVPEDFEFRFTRGARVGYAGYAVKR